MPNSEFRPSEHDIRVMHGAQECVFCLVIRKGFPNYKRMPAYFFKCPFLNT